LAPQSSRSKVPRPATRRRLGTASATILLLLPLTLTALPRAMGQVPADFVFSGGGWGHGLGMGQWGAKGQAEAGRTYDQILHHYYTGSAVGRGDPMPPVRVGVLWDVGTVDVTGSWKVEFQYKAPGGELLATGNPNETWRVSTDEKGSLHLATAGRPEVIRPGGPNTLNVIYSPHGTTLRLPQTGNRYVHGVLEISSYERSGRWLVRAVITELSMQHYLYGLGEMPSSWHMEALKAQAVAARTYAAEKIARVGQSRLPCACGMFSSTLDQSYVGFEKEGGPAGERWRTAVDSTDALVVKVNDKPIEAYYHSSSGGHTEHNELVWGGTPRSYLRGVPDPWDSGPHHTWTVRYKRLDLQNRLRARPDTDAGELLGIELVPPFGVSGRILGWASPSQGGVRLKGSSGEKRVSGSKFRLALGLLSTLFYEGEPKAAQVPKPGITHPDGSLIKGSATTVYLVEEGRKRPIPSTGVLESRFEPREVVAVSDQTLGTYPEGQPVTYKDGSLLNAPGGPVWVVSDGKRLGFSSAQIFEELGYSWPAILPVAENELKLLPEGPPITQVTGTHPNGTVIKGGGSEVYLVEGGEKRLIFSQTIFSSRFRERDIVSVSDAELGVYPVGQKLGFRDGSLIKGPSGAIFVISKGQRRPISADRFNDYRYAPENVREASDEEVQIHPEGEPL
jgi:peptidoglycan hydrolase-like amidase